MNHEMKDLDSTLCKARGIVRVIMDSIGCGEESIEEIEYSLWAVSDLLSTAIRQCNDASERADLGKDELAFQDEKGIIHLDELLPEEGPELRVTPDGAVITTNDERNL
jgi:hypothetical protein